MRHRDLHQRMLLAKYNLSRLLDRMQVEELIERKPVDDDGRGEYVLLTQKGMDLQKKAWPVYRKAIGRHFSGRLSGCDVGDLLRILQKLL